MNTWLAVYVDLINGYLALYFDAYTREQYDRADNIIRAMLHLAHSKANSRKFQQITESDYGD